MNFVCRKDGLSKYHTSEVAKNRIDGYLRRIAKLQVGLGKDSTEEEKKQVRDAQAEIYKKIRDVDYIFYCAVTPSVLVPLPIARKIMSLLQGVDDDIVEELNYLLDMSDV